jgi:hypothetical protein
MQSNCKPGFIQVRKVKLKDFSRIFKAMYQEIQRLMAEMKALEISKK